MAKDSVALSEKEKILGRLYALRAGLSVVAQEKEQADAIMRKAESSKETETKRAQSRLKTEMDIPAELESSINGIKARIDTQEGYLADPALGKRIFYMCFLNPIVFVIRFLVMYCIPIFAIVFGSLQCAYYGKDYGSNGFLKAMVVMDSDWGWEFIVGGIIIAVVLTIVYIKKEAIGWLNLKPHWCSLQQRKAAPQIIEELNREKESLTCKLNDAVNNVQRAKRQRQSDIERINAEYSQLREQAIEHAVAGLAVINSLEDSFVDMIDTRDWENVDILIYALETRRAENMKEALQVVDGERRTERIMDAVNTAGQEICKSIHMGLRRLQGEMTRCFGLISDQILLQSQIMANEMGGIRSSLADSNAYLSQLTSQQSMANALQAQANKNSAALVSEATRLRTGAEYTEAQLLYGIR